MAPLLRLDGVVVGRGNGEVALDDTMRAEWLSRADRLGHEGLRVLACATRIDQVADAAPYDRLVLAGLVGLEDPARADVPPAIQDCRQSGIRVVMVTGDHVVTAKSIGRAVGLGENVSNVMEGKNIRQMIETGQPALQDIGIFARVTPDEKLALVRTYQAAGEIVAMTGDGVNDAPALRQADIGVAMGLRGTDVAREAAAMILLDDAFPTIIKAIHEGRVIFANIRRFVAYLLSCNLSEVLAVGLAVSLAGSAAIMFVVLYLAHGPSVRTSAALAGTLVGIGITPWVELLFPLWILALSLDILLAGRRASPAQRPAEPSSPGEMPAAGPR